MCEEWCGRLQVGHKAWPHAPSNNRLVWCHMQLANLVAYDRRCEIRWANVLIYFISSWKLLGSLHNPLPHPQLAWLSSSFGWSHQPPAMTRKWDESETNNLVFNMARMKLPKADVFFPRCSPCRNRMMSLNPKSLQAFIFTVLLTIWVSGEVEDKPVSNSRYGSLGSIELQCWVLPKIRTFLTPTQREP